jgi:hypothetical protein
MAQSSRAAPISPTPKIALLVLVDIGAIAVFVVAGELSHGVDPVANAARVAYVLGPFLGGWFAVALLAGLYTEAAVVSVSRAFKLTAPAWAATVAIALAIRALPAYEGGAAPTFAAVALAVGGSLVLGSRLVFAILNSRL